MNDYLCSNARHLVENAISCPDYFLDQVDVFEAESHQEAAYYFAHEEADIRESNEFTLFVCKIGDTDIMEFQLICHYDWYVAEKASEKPFVLPGKNAP